MRLPFSWWSIYIQILVSLTKIYLLLLLWRIDLMPVSSSCICFYLLSSYHKLASLQSNPFMLCTPFSHPLLSFLFSYPRLRLIRTHQIHPTLLLGLLQLPHFLHQMRRMRKMGKWREKIPVSQSPKMTLLLLVCFPLAPSGRYACLWAPLNFFHYVM